MKKRTSYIYGSKFKMKETHHKSCSCDCHKKINKENEIYCPRCKEVDSNE